MVAGEVEVRVVVDGVDEVGWIADFVDGGWDVGGDRFVLLEKNLFVVSMGRMIDCFKAGLVF